MKLDANIVWPKVIRIYRASSTSDTEKVLHI